MSRTFQNEQEPVESSMPNFSSHNYALFEDKAEDNDLTTKLLEDSTEEQPSKMKSAFDGNVKAKNGLMEVPNFSNRARSKSDSKRSEVEVNCLDELLEPIQSDTQTQKKNQDFARASFNKQSLFASIKMDQRKEHILEEKEDLETKRSCWACLFPCCFQKKVTLGIIKVSLLPNFKKKNHVNTVLNILECLYYEESSSQDIVNMLWFKPIESPTVKSELKDDLNYWMLQLV